MGVNRGRAGRRLEGIRLQQRCRWVRSSSGSKILKSIFCLLENLSDYSDPYFLYVHVMFTRHYCFEYKFNNMENINVVFFEKSTLALYHELFGLGQVTENRPVHISGLERRFQDFRSGLRPCY